MKENSEELIRGLRRQFGSYRAEWNGDDLFRHFAAPCYFALLEHFYPCVLQGGRGSGKTTTLKGLSYQGQYKIHNEDISSFDSDVKYIGLYRRVDMNQVRIFRGSEVDKETWIKLFGHFFNLEVLLDIVSFLNWHKQHNVEDKTLPFGVLQRVFGMLFFKAMDCHDYETLETKLREEIYDFQCVVNNIGSFKDKLPMLSTIGEPIRYFLLEVYQLPQFKNKRVFILLDEYENFEDYQQAVINTQIKHSSNLYTFKIGVKEQGWRERRALNEKESLCDPADYELLDINESFESGTSFRDFARDVCQKRFEMVLGKNTEFNVEKALLSLSNEEEADWLGVGKSDSVIAYNRLPDDIRSSIGDIPDLYKFTIAQWAETHETELKDEALQVAKNRPAWDVRYNNYKYQMLFRIKSGRGSGVLQKYYCGFDTFVKLASNNIRFLMQLICRTFERHWQENGIEDSVSPELQTLVAKGIGEKNLAQLEGECREGSQIVRLVMGLGGIFGYLARKDRGTAEVNQFVVSGLERDAEMKSLVDAAVLHMALIRTPGDKLNRFESKSYEYNLHPIFAPFFTFSYRKKRKMQIELSLFRGLTEDPNKYIKVFLSNQSSPIKDENRSVDSENEGQLELGLI